MGRRSEQRIAASLPILVRGIDSNGQPFTQTAKTRDVSASGACIEGLIGVKFPGQEFQVEYQGRNAHFQVKWVGTPGTYLAGLVGVRCIDEGKYIWGINLAASTPDNYDLRGHPPLALESPAEILTNSGAAQQGASSEILPWAGNERRQFPRVSCRIEARVASAGSTLFLPATVTDACIGGCYLEMLSPLPLDSEVELRLGSAEHTIHARGRVRSALSGMGMGVSFTGMSPADLRKLQRIVPALPGMPGSYSLPSSPSEPIRSSVVASTMGAASATNALGANGARATGGTYADGSRSDFAAGDKGRSEFALSSLPQFPPTTAEALEAVVRVLFRKGILDQSELAAELQRLKSPRT